MRADDEIVGGVGPVDRLDVDAAGLAIDRKLMAREPCGIDRRVGAELDRLPAGEILGSEFLEHDPENPVAFERLATGAARQAAIRRHAAFGAGAENRAAADRALRCGGFFGGGCGHVAKTCSCGNCSGAPDNQTDLGRKSPDGGLGWLGLQIREPRILNPKPRRYAGSNLPQPHPTAAYSPLMTRCLIIQSRMISRTASGREISPCSATNWSRPASMSGDRRNMIGVVAVFGRPRGFLIPDNARGIYS